MLDVEVFDSCLNKIEITLGRVYTREQKSIYYEVLKDIPNEDFFKVTVNLLRNHSFSSLPLPADFIKNRISLEDLKLEKYYEVKEKITLTVRNVSVQVIFDDPLIHVIVPKLGGLEKLKMMTKEEFKYTMDRGLKELIDVYYDNYTVKDLVVPLGSPFYLDGEALIKYSGDKNKIDKWLNAYSKKIEGLKSDRVKALLGSDV